MLVLKLKLKLRLQVEVVVVVVVVVLGKFVFSSSFFLSLIRPLLVRYVKPMHSKIRLSTSFEVEAEVEAAHEFEFWVLVKGPSVCLSVCPISVFLCVSLVSLALVSLNILSSSIENSRSCPTSSLSPHPARPRHRTTI